MTFCKFKLLREGGMKMRYDVKGVIGDCYARGFSLQVEPFEGEGRLTP